MANKIYYAAAQVFEMRFFVEDTKSPPGVVGYMLVFDDAEKAGDYAEEEDITLISFVSEVPEEEEVEDVSNADLGSLPEPKPSRPRSRPRAGSQLTTDQLARAGKRTHPQGKPPKPQGGK